MWPESEQKIESSRDRHGEREKEGSRVRFSAHETVQGRGMNSVKLHCVCVCVRVLLSSSVQLGVWSRVTQCWGESKS